MLAVPGPAEAFKPVLETSRLSPALTPALPVRSWRGNPSAGSHDFFQLVDRRLHVRRARPGFDPEGEALGGPSGSYSGVSGPTVVGVRARRPDVEAPPLAGGRQRGARLALDLVATSLDDALHPARFSARRPRPRPIRPRTAADARLLRASRAGQTHEEDHRDKDGHAATTSALVWPVRRRQRDQKAAKAAGSWR